MTFHEALTDYVDAHHKPIEIVLSDAVDDGDWVVDVRKSQNESAWILTTQFESELDDFIQSLIDLKEVECG